MKEPHDRRLLLVRRMALICTVLMLATITLSAFMRLSQAGLGCAEWPQCYAQAQREAAPSASPLVHSGHGVAAARVAHRIVASVVLILAIMMTLATLATRPRLRRTGLLSAGILLLALALAALGIATPNARVPAVVLGNLIGGFAMLALCWRAAMPPSTQHLPWARTVLVVLTCQIALGALVSGSFAALSCTDWADCSRAAQAAGWDWRALNPWQVPTLEATPRVNAAGSLVQLAHRAMALVAAAALATLAVAAWRRGERRIGVALLTLTTLQVLLGPLAVALGLPIALVLLHNLTAALLLALVVGVS